MQGYSISNSLKSCCHLWTAETPKSSFYTTHRAPRSQFSLHFTGSNRWSSTRQTILSHAAAVCTRLQYELLAARGWIGTWSRYQPPLPSVDRRPCASLWMMRIWHKQRDCACSHRSRQVTYRAETRFRLKILKLQLITFWKIFSSVKQTQCLNTMRTNQMNDTERAK